MQKGAEQGGVLGGDRFCGGGEEVEGDNVAGFPEPRGHLVWIDPDGPFAGNMGQGHVGFTGGLGHHSVHASGGMVMDATEGLPAHGALLKPMPADPLGEKLDEGGSKPLGGGLVGQIVFA